jgi:hypothetical protein
MNFKFNNDHKVHDLYSLFTMKKNQFMEAYNKLKDKEKKWSISTYNKLKRLWQDI